MNAISPSTQVATRLAPAASGEPSKTAKSASLPGAIEPTREATPRISADESVIARSAAPAGKPPREATPAAKRSSCMPTESGVLIAKRTPASCRRTATS